MGRAQLHRFFNDPVHLVAGGEALRHVQREWRFRIAFAIRKHLSFHQLAADQCETCGVFTAKAIEQRDLVIRNQAQHVTGVMGWCFR